MPNDQSEIKVDCSLNQDFIMVWDNIVPDGFCDWLVDYLEKNSSYIMGTRSRNYLSDKQVEMHNFSPAEADGLQSFVNLCFRDYAEKYPYLLTFPFVSSCVLLQKTEPKEGYHAFHSENASWNSQNRTLAWMVYLNDVEEEGETEFLYQELKLKPKKGRVVIWPGSFTHLHRGNPPRSTKYIATGWYAACEGLDQRYVSPMEQ